MAYHQSFNWKWAWKSFAEGCADCCGRLRSFWEGRTWKIVFFWHLTFDFTSLFNRHVSFTFDLKKLFPNFYSQKKQKICQHFHSTILKMPRKVCQTRKAYLKIYQTLLGTFKTFRVSFENCRRETISQTFASINKFELWQTSKVMIPRCDRPRKYSGAGRNASTTFMPCKLNLFAVNFIKCRFGMFFARIPLESPAP